MSRFGSPYCALEAAISRGRLLTDREVAEITQMSVPWVRRQRLLNAGPPYRRLGGCIRYDPAELRVWLSSRPTGGELPQGVIGD